MEKYYWTIDFSIDFLSDLHIGTGITLLGGNRHGHKKDEDGFPYLPHTQVRGLVRMGAFKLKVWHPFLNERFSRNFRPGKMQGSGLWSYTSARYGRAVTKGADPIYMDILTQQSHIRRETDIAPKPFAYEKAGGKEENWRRWYGRIYSIELSEEEDVAFLIAAMRVEDRIGHRRSRGYGAVDWKVERIHQYQPGTNCRTLEKDLAEWLSLLFQREVTG